MTAKSKPASSARATSRTSCFGPACSHIIVYPIRVTALAPSLRVCASPRSRLRDRGRHRLPAATRRPGTTECPIWSPAASSASRTSLRASDERELRRELALGDPLQLGLLPRRHERVAFKGVQHTAGLEPQPARECDRGDDRLSRKGEPGVRHELESSSGPDVADPDRALTKRVEERSNSRPGFLWPRREDRQLAAALPGPCFPKPVRPATSRPDAPRATMAATRSIPATPMVLICTRIAPGASAASTPSSRTN